MKKISRKLLTSSLTLAFATVALGTTTFAWFTTNSTATATTTVGVQSSTTNLMFSEVPSDGSYSWKQSIALDFSQNLLEPATYDSTNKKLTKQNGEAVVSGTNYISAQFFVKVNGGVDVQFGDCSVTSSNVKEYALLAAVGDKAAGSKVAAAAGNALRMTATAAAQTDGVAGSWAKGDSDTAITTLGETIYSLGEDKTTTTIENYENFGDDMDSTAFANTYYDAVMGNTAGTTEIGTSYTVNSITKNSTNVFTAAAVGEGKDYKVYAVCLTFWLEGYDADCFDAILGQSMSIVVSFTTEKVTAGN